MTLVKIVKNKAYFKRFQVKFRRRREGKTDYKARKALIWQDKNKYGTPKYRMVVRFTNKDIICQIVCAKISGDEVLSSAYSHELPRYGLKVGLTNLPAAYCTGLLLARRTLLKLGMHEIYEGTVDVDGEKVELEIDENRRPFTANLDIGLKRNVPGAKVYVAMKGAVDGGLSVPHNEKCLPGYRKKEAKYSAEDTAAKINGSTIVEYMRILGDDEEVYNKRFSKYVEAEVDADNYEELIEEVRRNIREDPSPKEKREGYSGKKYKNIPKKNLKQRKDRIKQLKESHLTALRASNEN